MSKHYVYVHKALHGSKKGRVFYVGKGSGHRAKSSTRNFLWKRFADKYGWYVEIVRTFSSSSEAFRYEEFLVSHYRRKGYLCNLTDGGSGCKNSETAAAKISEALQCRKKHWFVHDEYGEEFLTQFELKKKYGITGHNIPSVVSGAKKSAYGWYIKGMGEGRRTMLQKHRFHHPDHGVVEQTQKGLCQQFSLFRQAVNDVVNGKARSFKGWTLEGVSPGPEKNKAYSFVHESGIEFIGSQAELCAKYELNQSHISSVCQGARNKHKGWRIANDTDLP